MKTTKLFMLLLFALYLTTLFHIAVIEAYEHNNEFIPDVFPKKIITRIFSIPVDPGGKPPFVFSPGRGKVAVRPERELTNLHLPDTTDDKI